MKKKEKEEGKFLITRDWKKIDLDGGFEDVILVDQPLEKKVVGDGQSQSDMHQDDGCCVIL